MTEIERLFAAPGSLMSFGERATLEGLLARLRPACAIEIGTNAGASLELIAPHSASTHTFDLRPHPQLEQEHFDNVTFHWGDSHELLPPVLADLAETGTRFDFALVDGDHAAGGVRRDVQDLLGAASDRALIVVHDTLNERVRAGLTSIPLDRYERITYVNLDLVPGYLYSANPKQGELWGGLGLIAVGYDGFAAKEFVPPSRIEDPYTVFETYRQSGGGSPDENYFDELRRLEKVTRHQRASLESLENSLSWRLTSPLRRARTHLRRAATAEKLHRHSPFR